MLKILTLISLLLNTALALATPKHIEVWFLSVNKTSFIDQLLPKIKFSPFISQQQLQCQPMGDYCFDPQVGLYKQGQENKIEEALDYNELDKNEKFKDIDSARSLDRQMIDCENSNFFDVFCGEAKKEKNALKNKLEIWVDISSTMKQVDFNGFDQMCFRESFLRQVNNKCPLNQKMKVYMFDESRKEVGAFDRVCLNSGLNEVKRIIRDIKASKVDNLIIITDIFEAGEELINYLESTGVATFKGLNEPLLAKDIKSQVERIQGMCK